MFQIRSINCCICTDSMPLLVDQRSPKVFTSPVVSLLWHEIYETMFNIYLLHLFQFWSIENREWLQNVLHLVSLPSDFCFDLMYIHHTKIHNIYSTLENLYVLLISPTCQNDSLWKASDLAFIFFKVKQMRNKKNDKKKL